MVMTVVGDQDGDGDHGVGAAAAGVAAAAGMAVILLVVAAAAVMAEMVWDSVGPHRIGVDELLASGGGAANFLTLGFKNSKIN
jgi:hypothetical protein